MKSVKEVLKQGNLPKGYPPTMLDVKTREKHVPESVHYNVDKHMTDHAHNAVEQIKKVHQVNPSQAHSLAEHSIKTLQGLIKDFESFKAADCKECK